MKKNKPFIRQFIFVIMLTTASGFLFGQSCPSGMISYWKLQESSGPDYEDSYGSHDAAALSSAPSQAAGVSGKGQYFNASASTSLDVDDHSDFDWSGTESFSIELWVKYTETGSIRVFIGRDDPSSSMQWWIGQESTGEITWYLSDGDGGTDSYMTTGSAYNTGQWVHVVAVRNGSTDINSLYVNNSPQTLMVNYNDNFSATGTAEINVGYLGLSPYYYFTGSIDEIAVYDRALGASEIEDHYNNTRLYQIGYCDGNEPVFLSDPDIYATVGQPYSYDADASGNPLPVYSLQEYPTGMAVNSTTGEISWTPASATVNGHVVLRATNSWGYEEQEFNVYVAEAPDCRNNLIAYWDFDEAGTPYIDNMEGYELSGQSPAFTNGKVNGALFFDGVNDSLNMKDPYEYPELIFFDFDDVPDFSFEVWMRSDATLAASQVMVMVGRESTENQSQYWLGVQDDGSVGFSLRDYGGNENFIEGGSVLDDAWHHIVATYNATSNSMKLYIDKALIDETTQNFSNFGCGMDLNIGYLNTSIDKFWYEGLLDEVAFYNTDISSTVITENFNAANNGDGACVYNYAPVILTTPDTEVDEDSPYYYLLKATDIDEDDVLSISAETKPDWLNFTYTPGDTSAVLSGTPTNDDTGLHNVTLQVSDGSIIVDQEFTIDVGNQNDDPYFTSTPLEDATEDELYVYEVEADDDDGDELEITAVSIPDWLELRNDSLVGTPEDEDVGTHPVSLRVDDGTVTVDQNFTIEVSNSNDAPVFTSVAPTSAFVGTELVYTATASDVDEDDVLTFSSVFLPGWLDFNETTAVLSGTPTEDDLGENAVILQVSDGTVQVFQNITITVSVTGLEDHESGMELLVYPNPATEEIHFEFYANGSKRIMIYDMAGNAQRDILTNEDKKVDISVSGLPQGIYIYKVFCSNEVIVGKFSKK